MGWKPPSLDLKKKKELSKALEPIVPVPRDDQKIIAETFVVLGKTRDKYDWCVPCPQIVVGDLAIMTTINPIDIVVG